MPRRGAIVSSRVSRAASTTRVPSRASEARLAYDEHLAVAIPGRLHQFREGLEHAAAALHEAAYPGAALVPDLRPIEVDPEWQRPRDEPIPIEAKALDDPYEQRWRQESA